MQPNLTKNRIHAHIVEFNRPLELYLELFVKSIELFYRKETELNNNLETVLFERYKDIGSVDLHEICNSPNRDSMLAEAINEIWNLDGLNEDEYNNLFVSFVIHIRTLFNAILGNSSYVTLLNSTRYCFVESIEPDKIHPAETILMIVAARIQLMLEQ